MTGQHRERTLNPKYLLAILAAVAVLIIAPLVARKGAEFAGADTLATDKVTEIDPGYEQWFDGWWSPPSGEVESFLFALQAALGASVIGYVAGTRRRSKGTDAQLAEPATS
ncbi:MAG: energy-coupling factor ABC transporter substrate-binding protein [Ilumatobacteraceae bacterium]